MNFEKNTLNVAESFKLAKMCNCTSGISATKIAIASIEVSIYLCIWNCCILHEKKTSKNVLCMVSLNAMYIKICIITLQNLVTVFSLFKKKYAKNVSTF